MTLNKQQILEASDIQMVPVDVPEWGGVVMVKGLTGKERDQFESSIVSFKGRNQTLNLSNIRAKLACLAICDEDGNRLFSEKELEELANKSAQALQRIFLVAQQLSGITGEDVDDYLKNSESGPTDAFTSD